MMQEPRSLLFVPGTRPERFDKAINTGADLVCIDLEDAVAPVDKSTARSTVLDFLPGAAPAVGVRINGLNTADGLQDAAALVDRQLCPGFVMLPKVESIEVLDLLVAWLGEHVRIVPIVETAVGLAGAARIFAHPNVHQAVFGGVDYAAEVGCQLDWEGLWYPRASLLNAAAGAGVTLLDAPFTDVKNLDALAEDVRRTKSLGMRARAAIHPDQVAVIHAAFAPTEDEVVLAQRVVQAYEAAKGGAALLDGKLIELPVLKAAQRVLDQV